MTRQEYEALFSRYMSGKVNVHQAMLKTVDLFYENERLQGRIHELEETLDGYWKGWPRVGH